VIDDEEAIRKSFLLAFEDTEYQMDVAESGERGIQMKKNNKYDLIYLDLKMPGRNGVEILREIRKTDKKIPIYIVTAFYEEFFDQLKSVEEGGINFDVLRKPVGADEILLVTKSVLEGPIGH
jgi:two-component system response regulator PilR (NtrC family)